MLFDGRPFSSPLLYADRTAGRARVNVSLILNLKCAVNLKLYSYLWERNPHWRSPR